MSLVWDSDHGDIGDGGVPAEEVLELGWRDLQRKYLCESKIAIRRIKKMIDITWYSYSVNYVGRKMYEFNYVNIISNTAIT